MYYIVAPQRRGFIGAKDGHAEWWPMQFEKEAIELAKRKAIEKNEPYEVYIVELIGCSTMPKSSFFDHRAQPDPLPT